MVLASMAMERDEVLAALRAIRERREEDEVAERREVGRARRLGVSWREIGEALGRSPSSIWDKHSEDP